MKTKFEEFKGLSKEMEMLQVELLKYVNVKDINILRTRIDTIDSCMTSFRKIVVDCEKKIK